MEEKELIEKIIGNDREAFRELYDKFSSRVYNTILGILQNTEDAEDVTQEVFIQIFRSIQNFKQDSTLSTWIYRITVNKALEFIRSKKRKKRFAIVKSIFAKEEVEEPIDFLHPGIIEENKERGKILFKAIEKLTDKQKTAFVLNKVENLSYKEISEIMKLSLSSVESLIFRAKENLKKDLYDFYKENF
ncbi:MAG: RNA polymerase sigma factor [Ignavibacteriae bacterium]|nr:RNA polymerase sigma factor [Ignavibacteriota bacterium]